MFEKEAEEYAENREVCGLLDAISEDLQNYDYGTVAHYNIDPLVEECFKDGAEFGYNKGNEWHYVKSGDLPAEDTRVLALMAGGEVCIAHFYRKNVWDKIGIVIAWKEITLPKEIKEK